MTGNAGNWYSWPAATAGGYHTTDGFNEPNSICPSGWQLTVNTETEVKSWYYLIRNTYNIQDKNDSNLLPQPMSFVRSGYYSKGSLSYRANYGNYWSSTANSSKGAHYLVFYSSSLSPQYNYSDVKHNGYSVRCVSR